MKTLIHKLKVWWALVQLKLITRKMKMSIENCNENFPKWEPSNDEVDTLLMKLTPPANEADATKKAVVKAKKKAAKKSTATKTRTTKRKAK